MSNVSQEHTSDLHQYRPIRQELDEVKKAFGDLRTEMTSLRHEHGDCTSERSKLLARLEDRESDITTLRPLVSEVAALKSEKLRYEHEVASLKHQLAGSQYTMSTSTSELHEFQAMLCHRILNRSADEFKVVVSKLDLHGPIVAAGNLPLMTVTARLWRSAPTPVNHHLVLIEIWYYLLHQTLCPSLTMVNQLLHSLPAVAHLTCSILNHGLQHPQPPHTTSEDIAHFLLCDLVLQYFPDIKTQSQATEISRLMNCLPTWVADGTELVVRENFMLVDKKVILDETDWAFDFVQGTPTLSFNVGGKTRQTIFTQSEGRKLCGEELKEAFVRWNGGNVGFKKIA